MAATLPRTLIGFSTAAAIIAGIALAAADLQHAAPSFMDPNTKFSDQVDSPLWLLHGLTHIVATTLLLAALPGLLLLHGDAIRPWGRIAFAAAFVLVSAYLGVSYIMALATPLMPPSVIDNEAGGAIAVAFLSYPLSAIALLVCGLAMTRAHVLPRWATLLFAAGAILTPVTEVLSSIVQLPVTGALVLGAGLVALGLTARAREGAAPAAPGLALAAPKARPATKP